MSIASFALAQSPVARATSAQGTPKPPPKRTVAALSDVTIIPEPR